MRRRQKRLLRVGLLLSAALLLLLLGSVSLERRLDAEEPEGGAGLAQMQVPEHSTHNPAASAHSDRRPGDAFDAPRSDASLALHMRLSPCSVVIGRSVMTLMLF